MNNFDFHYAGFRAVYTAKPDGYSVPIYFKDEYVTQLSVTEMQDMIREGKIVVVNKEKNCEAA